MKKTKRTTSAVSVPSLWTMLIPYKWLVLVLIGLSMLVSGLNLVVPKLIAAGIDTYTHGNFNAVPLIIQFSAVVVAVLAFSYLQSLVQVYTSEKVARDIRQQLILKISQQSYAYVQAATSAKLLTNLTSDVDAIKMFVSQAIVAIVSSLFLIMGASALLISLDWQLALAVLAILPMIGGSFYFVLAKVRKLFTKVQEITDWLNRVINESILASALIRVLNSQQQEFQKFLDANTDAKNIGLQILKMFAALIPIITFLANIAALVILVLGGHFVIQGAMTLGDFTAFNSYLAILIFPILVIGFMSNVLARASASYQRIAEVLFAPAEKDDGKHIALIAGLIKAKDISLNYEHKTILKKVGFTIQPGSKTAIIGPTGEGKTQLLYILAGLVSPSEGTVSYDNHLLTEYQKENFYQQVSFVFQDSVLFNVTLRENIAFSEVVREEDLQKAIETAELSNFVDALPEKLETVVSERGTSLSGGQKQRVMLARALALNPKVLLLDDFTARVDTATEKKILQNIEKNYPDLTLISVTQKIGSVKNYDQILLLMDGEILAQGTHKKLLETSPEYVQIYDSQKSTNYYEVRAE